MKLNENGIKITIIIKPVINKHPAATCSTHTKMQSKHGNHLLIQEHVLVPPKWTTSINRAFVKLNKCMKNQYVLH